MAHPDEHPQGERVTPAGARACWMTSMPSRPARDLTRLRHDTLVPAPLEATFAFFAEASNLQRLTPEWLQFSLCTPPPIVMRAGLEIDYVIRLHGVPIAWTSGSTCGSLATASSTGRWRARSCGGATSTGSRRPAAPRA